jgi:fructose-bisphosphate aldolase class II
MAFISLRQLLDHAAELAMTGAMRQAFSNDPSEFDPRKSLIAAKKAARALCKARFEAFGCSGHADHIEPIALDAMVNRHP